MPSDSQTRLDVGETRPPQVVERERRVTNADAVSMAMCAHEFVATDVEGWYTHEYADVVNEWVLENVEATIMRLLDYPDPHSTRRPTRPPLVNRLEAEYSEGSEQATLITDGGQPDSGTDRTLVITPSEFGDGDHYHKPREGEGGLPRCQGMFPQGTALRPKENAELDGLDPCGHPACFGGEENGE